MANKNGINWLKENKWPSYVEMEKETNVNDLSNNIVNNMSNNQEDFWMQDVTWEKVKGVLFKDINFGGKKEE